MSSMSSSFYSTYEELKLQLQKSLNGRQHSFYSTYEELKHKKEKEEIKTLISFYSTYEELKQLLKAITLPM